MKYYNWTEDIDDTSFLRLCNFVNDNQNEEIILHFQTNGGKPNVARALVEVINKHVKKLIVTGGVYSGGFYVVSHVKVPIAFTEGVIGMWHYAIFQGFAISVRNSKATYSEDICKVKNNKVYKKSSKELAKKVMTKKEYKEFKIDKDVYFSFKRMKEIFPNAEIV